MARQTGLDGLLRATVRAAAAVERERQRQIRHQAANIRQAERRARVEHNQRLRDLRTAEKEAKAQYLEDRQAEADDLNTEVQERLDDLAGILPATLERDDRIDFDSLRPATRHPAFKPPPELLPVGAPNRRIVPAPSWLQKLIPGSGKRHAAAIAEAEGLHQQAMLTFQQSETEKRATLAKRIKEHEAARAAHDAVVQARNVEVDAFKSAYEAKQPEAVVAYNEMVLTRSEYPADGFKQKFRVAYVPESTELVVEYELPEPSVVPLNTDYRYVRARDSIESKTRKPAEIKQIYQDVVAGITIRTLHELFEADQADTLTTVAFTGVRETHDPASGKDVRVAVISVRAIKAEFKEMRLDRVDKVACLKRLGAQVSSRPDELQAIKPVIEFDMVDKRFIENGDALAALESRQNLLQLTPSEFEVLVSNLFTRMGLDTKLTRASRDGGVDAVAFDVRPIVGGKVVIQAKRYKDTVGVSAVRDLYGTMQHEGANKGILVCTSGYGPDAYQFSKDKPIELIDGGGLLYLLREHAGIDARIELL